MVMLPELNNVYVNKHDYLMLFETKLCDSRNFMSYLFVDPVKIIKVYSLKDVQQAFCEIDKYSRKFYLAGYFSYELGYYFERGSFKEREHFETPLIHLGVFDRRFYFNHTTGETDMDIPGLFCKNIPERNFYIRRLRLNITPEEYRDKVLKIKEYIRKGDTYQVNLTAKYNFDFYGSAFNFYSELGKRQHVQYSAFCKLKDNFIISLSPELFFKREGLKIYSQPMKGTIKRGKNIKEDRENIIKLRESLKNKAENLMIVDLVRNDLGRVSKTNSVKVTEPFKVRKYETLLQMTSQVNGVLKKNIGYFDIFKNVFPGGSVTGAPKIRTMQIIKELEPYPRGVYCGALGFIAEGKRAVFNLPIRTISIFGHKAEMGIGSGIVYDSSADNEFRECKLKASFLTGIGNDFRLIETIAWANGFKFLKEHLSRMRKSAKYFGFPCRFTAMRYALKKAAHKLTKGKRYRVRLLLDKTGCLGVECLKMKGENKVKYAAISKYKIDPQNLFLYHKTTNRYLYEREYLRYKALGYFDVIFLNTKGEVAEGAISNVIIERNGKLYTPPISSGLLAGIYRKDLLIKGRVTEKIIYLHELLTAKKVFLCNSVRGMVEVLV